MEATETQVEAKRMLDNLAKEDLDCRVNTNAQSRFLALCALADRLDEEFDACEIKFWWSQYGAIMGGPGRRWHGRWGREER